MDENNSKNRKRYSGDARRCTKVRSKDNYSQKQKYHEKKNRECDDNNKTVHQVQNVVDKNNLQDTEASTETISSLATTACTLKLIHIEMDSPLLIDCYVNSS